MYLSRVIIQNYRSIEFLNITFSKGKNIIVGKNNSGKSNIISAIDLVLGEKSPSYAKSQNITRNDFHHGNYEKEIYICCEVKKENTDIIDFKDIKKQISGYYKTLLTFPLEIYELSPEISNSIETFQLKVNELLKVDPKNLEWVDKFFVKSNVDGEIEKDLNDVSSFLFIFKAYMDSNDIIQKDLRMCYKNTSETEWTIVFNSYIRNTILQSAIIPSFRDPSNQLRITDYSWYGKLLKSFTENGGTEEFSEACKIMREKSQELFSELIDDIQDPDMDIAYPGTNLILQCSSKNIDAHKMVMFYVDDGFESLLSEKGAGIQSTVVIGLFNYYIKKIAVSGSALLAIEEPELFLHPHARRIMAKRLDDFLDNEKNQVIITTHSNEFLTAIKPEINIIRIHKGEDKKTKASNVEFSGPQDLQIVLKTENAEMFFADKVVLVEGADKYVLEAVAKEYGKLAIEGNINWLNEQNISIISVGGKGNFLAYAKVLSKLGINWYLLADFDFLIKGIESFLKEQFKNNDLKELLDELNAIRGKIGIINQGKIDGMLSPNLMDKISSLCHIINEKGLKIDPNDFSRLIKYNLKIKKLDDISDSSLCEKVKKVQKNLQEKNIFLLNGELENYLTDKAVNELIKEEANKIGKEQRIIYLISNILPNEDSIMDLIKCPEFVNLLKELPRKNEITIEK